MCSKNENDNFNRLSRLAEYFNIITNELNIAVFDWNFETGQSYVTDSGKNYLLCLESLDTILSNSASADNIHPDDLGELSKFFERTELGKERVEVTLRLKTVKNDYKWCRIIGLFSYNDKHIPIRTLGIIIDVNKEKKEAFEKDNIINAIPTGIGIFDVSNGVAKSLYMNDGFYRLVEDERQARLERTNNNFMNGIYPEDRAMVAQGIKSVIDGKESVAITCRALKGDGTAKWIRFNSSVGLRQNNHILVYTTYVSMETEVQAQQDMQRSRALLEIAIKSANMCVWEYDCKEHTIIQTKGSMEKHGYDKTVYGVPESLVDSGYVQKDSVKPFLQMYDDLHKTKNIVQGDFYVKSNNSDDCWWEHIILTPVIDNVGNLVKAYGTSIDVTDRKEQEEQYYRQIGVMSETDDKNLLVKAQYNLTKRKLVYYSAMRDDTVDVNVGESYKTVINTLSSVIIDDDDKMKAKEVFNHKNLLKQYDLGHREGSCNYKRKFKDNPVMFARVNYLMSEDPKTEEIILFVYFYDDTEHMLESKILEQLGTQEYDGIGIIDIATESYMFKNLNIDLPIHVTLKGSDYYKQCEAVVNNSIIDVEKKYILKCLETGNIIKNLESSDVYSIQYSVYTGENNENIRRMQLQFRYIDSSKTSLLYTFSNITEIYKQQQEQLNKTQRALALAEKATKAKTEFLSRMSHDIRTPLNAILGAASLAQSELDDAEAMKEYIETINLSGRFLLGLINDILDINKIESGKIELRPELCLVSEFSSSIDGAIRPLMEKKHINFVFKMECGYKAIVVDKLRHHQIFFNLLSNAAKYTPEGGTVEYITQRIDAPEGMAGVRNIVRDNGIGMTDEYMSHLFEPFTRDKNAEINQIEGSGLGLAIVKNIVETMGGTIKVKSELGKGTEFVVDLFMPIGVTDSSAKEESAKYNESLLIDSNILLVDDNKINIKIGQKMLQKAKCNVIVAVNGQDAVEKFSESDEGYFDAILMDIRMPIMNGLDASKTIRSLDKSDADTVPIIAMTADAFSEDVIKTKESGMDAHIAKPVEADNMYKIISNCIANRKSR